jgi:glycosyltransferase involved in cell wall biosynthesis
MKIAFIARSTLFNTPGGDTIQVRETARHLVLLGVTVDVRLANETIDYKTYDLLHFFNITRPADILYHIRKSRKPFVVSPIYIDYSEFDREHRRGLAGFMFRNLSSDRIEYVKTIARWVLRRDSLKSKSYIFKGQRRSIQEIIAKASLLLPNSESEFTRLKEFSFGEINYHVIPNGIDDELFKQLDTYPRNNNLVICAARIEGIKNQLNLIKALNNTSYSLLIIGSPAPGQIPYYNECRKIAAENITFHSHVSQDVLRDYYQSAHVHALPSWFETCGLSTLEAAAMGCKVIVTERGYTRDYFGKDAFYCDPSDPQSIYETIELAASSSASEQLKDKILSQYTWKLCARKTLEAYNKIKY